MQNLDFLLPTCYEFLELPQNVLRQCEGDTLLSSDGREGENHKKGALRLRCFQMVAAQEPS